MPTTLVRGRLLIVAVMALTCGCHSRPSEEPDVYVGEYVFKPNVDSGTAASFLVLKRDGSAVQVRRDKRTEVISTVETTWHLNKGPKAEVIMGDTALPIETSGGRVRLRIDYDVDAYYEKIR